MTIPWALPVHGIRRQNVRKWTLSVHGVRRQNVRKLKCVIVPKGGKIDTPKYSGQ